MPLIRYLILTLVLCLCIPLSYAQSDFDCLSIDTSGLSKRGFESFEKDLFSHYNFQNDSLKTYRTFLAEVASLSLDLRKIPSDSSIQVTREFKNATSKNTIWVKLSEYESDLASKKPSTPSAGNEEDVLIFNYRGGLIQCLKNNSMSNDFKDIVASLEIDGNVSTSLIAQKLYYLPDDQFKTKEIKKFIAFDIYYSILMVIERAFK